MRSSVRTTFVLTLLAGATFWMLATQRAPPPVVDASSASSLSSTSNPPSSQPLSAPLFATSEPRVSVVAQVPASPSSAVASTDSFDVLVVGRETGAPIADAHVCGLTYREFNIEEARSATLARLHVTDALASPEFAQRSVRTDEHGLVALPIDPRWNVFVVRAPGRWGSFEIERSDGRVVGLPVAPRERGKPVRIELALDHELVVDVVDESGARVAGAPVEFVRFQEHWDDESCWRDRTDANGTVRVPHVQQLFDGCSEWQKLGVRVAVLGTDGAHTEVPKGARELLLVAPPWGSLLVKTVDDAGHRARASGIRARGTTLHIRGSFAGAESVDAATGLTPIFFDRGEWVPDISDGRARFPFVQLGLHIELCGNLAEHDRARVIGAGPTKPGEEAVLELRFGPRCIVLTGAMRFEDGKPVANVQFDLLQSAPGTPDRQRVFTTDANGRFRCTLGNDEPVTLAVSAVRAVLSSEIQRPESWPAPGSIDAPDRIRSCLLDFRAHDTRASAGGFVQIQSTRDLVRGENDLGVLVLTLPPLIASGRVVDARGFAVAGVGVYARNPLEGRGASAIASCDTDADGQFELRSDRTGPEIELRLSSTPFFDPPLRRVPLGAREVVLQRPE